MRRQSIPLFFLLVVICLPVLGCNATNDNPINPDKMNEMRKKEAAERGNFKPTGTPPGAGMPSSTGK